MKLRAGDFSLDDAPQSGRPVEVDSDQIETLIDNNQHSITREIANILKISKSIKLLVKMKNMSFILQKKTYGLLGQPNILAGAPLKKTYVPMMKEKKNNISLFFFFSGYSFGARKWTSSWIRPEKCPSPNCLSLYSKYRS